jgi:DNA-binding beta-propeller fold protein YncE
VKIRQVATIDTDETDCNTGLAVSADGSVLAVSNERHDEITLYALPSGDKVRAFGDKGSEPGQFRNSLKLCFTPDNTLLVAEWKNKRVQEVTLTGEHRRFVGAGALSGDVVSVTCNSDVVVVGQSNDTQCISVFDYVTGDLLRGFGEQGRAVGKLQVPCGLQLSSDGRHVIVADSSNHNVSVFTLSGAFVGSFGSHSILTRPADVALMPCGDVVVCGHTSHRVAIFSPDGRRVKQFGAQGDGKGQFQHPTSVAVCGTRIYVLDNGSSRVQVFEYR